MKKVILFALLIGLVLCSGYTEKKTPVLDVKAYLKHANGDTLYPSAVQLAMLRKVLPEKRFRPAPSIQNRTYWNTIRASESGQHYLTKAKGLLDSKPEVPITDSIYRLANKEGNRAIYKPRYYRTMDRLEHYILGECLENKGQFLQQIISYSEAILAMKSWLHPNHDDKNNGVLEGKRMTIDLGARKFGSVLALAESLLGNKLPATLRTEIDANLQKRISDTYLQSVKYLDENNTWIKSTSNWNSVCTSGTILTMITNSKSYDERIAAVGAALNSMNYYLTGFGDDGYCSEGLGYWGYGFGHYLYLAQILYDYSGGRIDLFKFDHPEKLRNVGNFPENFEIQNGTCAPFADGVSSISSSGSNFAYVLSSEHYGANRPVDIRMEEAAEQLIAWQNPKMFEVSSEKKIFEVPGHTYFDDFGMVISRGQQAVPFSIAIKAGHNAENHNHSDVGTYELFLGIDMITGDIGAPSYTAGAFAKDNPARSSWGHPVPKVNHELQSNGIEFKGKILETKFTPDYDKVVMDIKSAYQVPGLQNLVRTMRNDKTAEGAITISDSFSAEKPMAFGTTIMTLNDYKIIDERTILLTSENQKVKVEINSSNGDFAIQDEKVPVAHLREGAPAYRLGVDLKAPSKQGTITIRYTPVL